MLWFKAEVTEHQEDLHGGQPDVVSGFTGEAMEVGHTLTLGGRPCKVIEIRDATADELAKFAQKIPRH